MSSKILETNKVDLVLPPGDLLPFKRERVDRILGGAAR